MVFPCGECDKVFPKQWELERHVKIHNKVFLCEVCGFETKNKQSLTIQKGEILATVLEYTPVLTKIV